jgi:hypothetical protein
VLNNQPIPMVNQPASASNTYSAFGLGDINPQGMGPTFEILSATEDVLGQENWSAGPAAVVVVTTDLLVCGAEATTWGRSPGMMTGGR